MGTFTGDKEPGMILQEQNVGRNSKGEKKEQGQLAG